MLNVFKYFKKRVVEISIEKLFEENRGSDGLASWICQSVKLSTASSSAALAPVPISPALPASSFTAMIETSPSATQKVHPRTIILDDFGKCVIYVWGLY